ncbi:vWA domain-containing protein [Paludisphaera mucosa]|uniref:Magnesium chelatase n=1 Tax=Paludisphaera mucosa TaxID=3030827 RepID=A0ABT6F757_9BACT|nr:magnesium chelatase [Paludisphaera mucosa]MDG3003423.1 magnesium chelatase [Paludisphaera mucosa]
MRATRRTTVALLGLVLFGMTLRASAQQAPPADASKVEKPKPEAKPRRERDQAPKVRTPEEDEARKRSPFLQGPGGSEKDAKYDGENLRDLPPWSRASFFGIAVRGRFVVYVLDQSGSMIDDDRMSRATIELRKSVAALQSPQQFEVFFYNEEATTMPGGPIPRSADQRNKDLLRTWLRMIEPDGGTSPREAVVQALSLRPDAVFLLSDGDFPDGTVEAVARANGRKIPIHCVDMAGGLAGDALQRIARDSGGRYASRPGNLHDVGSGR